MTATKEVIGPAVGGLFAMLCCPVGMLWILKMLTKSPATDRTLCMFQSFLGRPQISNASSVVTSIYPGIFMGAGIARGIWGLHLMYLRWSQAVRDKEFLVEMRLRNLEAEETKGKAVEKREEQEQEHEREQERAAVQDLPVLDLIENQSDGESDNEERFLL